MPNNWTIGDIGGLFVDRHDHIWIYVDHHDFVYVAGNGQKFTGQFHWPHVVSVDSAGNVYTGEVDGAARIQKFIRYGASGCSGNGVAEVGAYR